MIFRLVNLVVLGVLVPVTLNEALQSLPFAVLRFVGRGRSNADITNPPSMADNTVRS